MRGYSAIGLFNPKTNTNVGSVLRAAGCFGVSMVVIQGQRYTKAPTDTTQMFRHIPLLHGDLRESIPFGCIPVAVDLIPGAKSLHSYSHPERAFYIFGPEDGSIPKHVLSWCADTVYVPTDGCMNLAASVNVLLYDRQMKRFKDDRIMERKRMGYERG